jgi:hypothetical protein
MKLVCNLLKQRLSFFAILRNLIKDHTVGFAAGEESCFTRGRAKLLSEKKPVGDLIVFKPARGGARVGAAAIDHGTVVVFTGVWQERHEDESSEIKRARRVSGRRSGKSGGKPGGGPQK